jgi:hypothetical protein
MLKRLKADWPFVAALALFLGFWSLGLTGSFPNPHPKPHAQISTASSTNSSPKSVQDISAETVAYYTEVLAWFTGVLAVTSLVQGFFLWNADKTARIAANAAKKSADVAIQALTDLERPYLFIYGIGFERSKDGTSYPKMIYDISNNGKFSARVEQVSTRLGRVNMGQYPPLIIDGDNPILSEPIITAGSAPRSLDCLVRPEFLKYEPPARFLRDGIIFQVVISYRGPFTRGHETAQCWRYNKSPNGFVEITDEHYTYIR